MKIIWNDNPLKTEIILNRNEQVNFYYLYIIDAMKDYIEIANNFDDKLISMNYLKKANNCLKTHGSLAKNLINSLRQEHVGDCTCIPASCDKCEAESFLAKNVKEIFDECTFLHFNNLEFDTIKGLGKHEAHKIVGAFANNRSLGDALLFLRNYPERENWPDWAEQHTIKGWKKQALSAYNWLHEYQIKLNDIPMNDFGERVSYYGDTIGIIK